VEDVGGVFLTHPLTLELRKPWLRMTLKELGLI